VSKLRVVYDPHSQTHIWPDGEIETYYRSLLVDLTARGYMQLITANFLLVLRIRCGMAKGDFADSEVVVSFEGDELPLEPDGTVRGSLPDNFGAEYTYWLGRFQHALDARSAQN
jgi:hypothetical protein